MNLFEYIKQQPRGAIRGIAIAVDAHLPDVSRWVSGSRPVPVNKVLQIEKATNGVVTRKDLRPNDWQLIWPEGI